MQKSILGLLAVLMFVATPALAAWVGNVDDVAPADTVRIRHADNTVDPTDYFTVLSAYSAAVDGDTLLVGPGTYTFNNGTSTPGVGNSSYWTKQVSVVGSGSGEDPLTNTVWSGPVDANGETTHATFLMLGNINGGIYKDFRLANAITNGIMVRSATSTENIGTVAQNFTFENMAFVNLGMGAYGTDGGFADSIQFGRTASNVTVKNNLFDGDGTAVPQSNGQFGLRMGNSGIQNTNFLFEGNTFQNLRAGLVFNGYKAETIRVLNNTFANISEYLGDGQDGFNSWGSAAIQFYPRSNSATTTDAWVKDVVIAGNSFAEAGYLADETGNLDPHPWEDTLMHDAGIGFTLCSGTKVENVMIRNNTFTETAADGQMERAINIVVSDAATYVLGGAGALTQTWTGVAGTLKNVVVDGNTYTGVNTIRAIQWSNGTIVTSLGQPDLFLKNGNGATVTIDGVDLLADADNDNDIDGYDITNLAEDLNGDSVVNDDDKIYLLTVALKTKVGDFNLDGLVDGLDFLKWQAGFNQPGAEDYGKGNCTGGPGLPWDSDTDGLDFLKWQANFPTSTNWYYPAGSAVPEPATLALLALGGLAALRRRR